MMMHQSYTFDQFFANRSKVNRTVDVVDNDVVAGWTPAAQASDLL